MDRKPLSLVHLARPSSRRDTAPGLLVLLHGNGADEHFLFDRVQHFDPRLIIVSPRGPVAVAPGRYAWLRVTTTAPLHYLYDPQEAQAAFVTVLGFLHEAATTYHVDPTRVYLMGHSQGAIFGGAVGITHPEAVAGMVLLGAGIEEDALALAAPPERLAHLACFLGHGTDDSVIPIRHIREIRRRLSALVPALTYREYPMRHDISAACLTDVSTWLTAQLDAPAGAPRPVR